MKIRNIFNFQLTYPIMNKDSRDNYNLNIPRLQPEYPLPAQPYNYLYESSNENKRLTSSLLENIALIISFPIVLGMAAGEFYKALTKKEPAKHF